ncbi:ketosteroid isomerase-related protein [Luteibacter sp. E-22]|uniref:ketosteroid isomerase-related protein n=1 Tax=Luteibacter sp. E-22 TaxID=3404050 RepID=UPI003CEBB309
MNETIDLIRRYYDAFNRGDWASMLALLDEHVVHDINQGGREPGRDRFAAFLQRMNMSYSEQLKNIVVMANETGTRAAAEYVVHGVYKATDEGLPLAQGQSYVLPGGAFFEVSRGRITRISNYYNLEDWLAQVRRVEVD